MDLSLYFLPLIDESLAKKSLKTRVIILKKIYKDLLVLRKKPTISKPQELILSHDLDLVQAEILSTERLITQL